MYGYCIRIAVRDSEIPSNGDDREQRQMCLSVQHLSLFDQLLQSPRSQVIFLCYSLQFM